MWKQAGAELCQAQKGLASYQLSNDYLYLAQAAYYTQVS